MTELLAVIMNGRTTTDWSNVTETSVAKDCVHIMNMLNISGPLPCLKRLWLKVQNLVCCSLQVI